MVWPLLVFCKIVFAFSPFHPRTTTLQPRSHLKPIPQAYSQPGLPGFFHPDPPITVTLALSIVLESQCFGIMVFQNLKLVSLDY